MGYSVIPTIGTGGYRLSEWWVWDLESHKLVKKKELDSHTGMRFAVRSDGKKLYVFGIIDRSRHFVCPMKGLGRRWLQSEGGEPALV